MPENQLHSNSPLTNDTQNFGGTFNLVIYYIIDIGHFVGNW